MADNDQFQADDCRCTAKLYADILTRCVNSLDTRLSRELRDSSDVARKQGEGGRNDVVRIDVEVENIERKLNDVQEILDAVSELTNGTSSNGNPSYSTTSYLRTLKTSVMKSVRDVLNATCESIFLGTAGAARTTTVGAKRGRADVVREDVERGDVERGDVERDADERGAAKRRKTRHDDDNGAETSDENRSRRRNVEPARTTSVGTKRERDAAERPKWPRTRRDGGEQTRTVAAANEYANRSTTEIARTETSGVDRKSQFCAVVVSVLNPYYERGVFATVDLFRFMARTIVHRLMHSALGPDDYAVKSTIPQLIPPKIRITSEDEILTLIHPFY